MKNQIYTKLNNVIRMRFKTLLLMSLLVIGSQNISYCHEVGDVSLDNTFVANDQYAYDFYSRLNRDFVQLVNGVNNIAASQIASDTMNEAVMGDSINPRIRTYEGAACEFVYSGLLPETSASLTSNITAGTAYPRGYRINKASTTANSYTAQKWTYVDLDYEGNFKFSEVAIGAAAPAIATNSIRLAKVSSDTATLNTVTDLRTTSCLDGPFEVIHDTAGEANLEDMFIRGGEGYRRGLVISRDTTTPATKIMVRPGVAYIDGQYRIISVDTTVNSATVADPTEGVSGKDAAGALAAFTNYHVYAAADVDGVDYATLILSTSATTPAVGTKVVRIGEVSTDGAAVFSSVDPVGTAGSGKLIQRKILSTGAIATGTTVTVKDDTPITNAEGTALPLTLAITPSSASNYLLVTVDAMLSTTANSPEIVLGLFRDPGASSPAVASMVESPAGATQVPISMHLEYRCLAGSTNTTTFKTRAGGDLAETLTFNGTNGTRRQGGVMSSNIKVEEYEP